VGKATLKTESLTILLYSPYWRKWRAPHFRHSKSMHLLQANVNLTYIRDFLGHASVITTERYAKADSEIKRKAIEKASSNVVPDKKYSKKEKHELLCPSGKGVWVNIF